MLKQQVQKMANISSNKRQNEIAKQKLAPIENVYTPNKLDKLTKNEVTPDKVNKVSPPKVTKDKPKEQFATEKKVHPKKLEPIVQKDSN